MERTPQHLQELDKELIFAGDHELSKRKVRDAAPDLLEALEYHNEKPLHPSNPQSKHEDLADYNKDYKIWAKRFEELKKKAIEKATK